MKITHEVVSDCLVVAIDGRIDTSNMGVLGPQLNRLAERPEATLVIDLCGVDSMDSSGLSLLLGVYRRRQDSHQEVCLCGLSSEVRRLIELTRLHRLFRIYDSRSECVDRVA